MLYIVSSVPDEERTSRTNRTSSRSDEQNLSDDQKHGPKTGAKETAAKTNPQKTVKANTLTSKMMAALEELTDGEIVVVKIFTIEKNGEYGMCADVRIRRTLRRGGHKAKTPHGTHRRYHLHRSPFPCEPDCQREKKLRDWNHFLNIATNTGIIFSTSSRRTENLLAVRRTEPLHGRLDTRPAARRVEGLFEVAKSTPMAISIPDPLPDR